MNYAEAITAVNTGKDCWRGAWPFGWYIKLVASTIYLYEGGPSGSPYHATDADKAGTDWAEGDRPPH
jgi:hypothetical protein